MDDVQPDLIFDLGMHQGFDTEFYLAKGFRVLALEANPALVEAARLRQAEALAAGRLALEDRALWLEAGQRVSFYVNPVTDDWSSVRRDWAEKGGHRAQEITVETTTLPRLLDTYGTPYYIKCDIEGADEAFVHQLLADRRRPRFVSVEAISLEVAALLLAAGYDRFQLVNQAMLHAVRPPQPAREGLHADTLFNGHMSGLFGRELDPRKWLPFRNVAEQYLGFHNLHRLNPDLALGWLDFHATRAEWVT